MMSSEWSSLQILDFAGLNRIPRYRQRLLHDSQPHLLPPGLTGPSMAIDSACSSSLTAVHQGCAALRSGEADTVIAAGVNLILTPALSIFYTQAGLSAPDGRCKPFGATPTVSAGVRASLLWCCADSTTPCRWTADLRGREELGHKPRWTQQWDHRPEPPVAGGS